MVVDRATAFRVLLLAAAAAGLWPAAPARAEQSFRRAGVDFNAVRPVEIPAERSYAVVVTMFFHHGQIRPDGKNVVVSARNRTLAPMRVLQVGPGDLCRLAFQPIQGQKDYEVFYGGPAAAEPLPPWTSRDGLLLETRRYSECDLGKFEAVRRAFDAAAPIGADYVPEVRYAWNPVSLDQGPFFSHFSGWLRIPAADAYGWITSSQDCSFLLIDDRVVTAAPGRHGPIREARPGTRVDIQLSAGLHKFDYYHAAAGDHAATMLVAWVPGPTSDKDYPSALPDDIFAQRLVGHLPAGRVSLRTGRMVPDFEVKIGGEVPLPDNPLAMVDVAFRNLSPKPLTMQGKPLWEFGDGQTSTLSDPYHIYLRPGTYKVKLSARHGDRIVEIVNRLSVDRPIIQPQDKPRQLDQYLGILETYEPRTLDAASLRQLVAAFEAKSLELEARAEGGRKRAEENQSRLSDAARAARAKHSLDDPVLEESRRWLGMAAAAGQKGLVEGKGGGTEGDWLELAKMVGPMARDRLGDSPSACQIWLGAARRVSAAEAKARCEIEAADVAVNDLLKFDAAKSLLDAAAAQLGEGKSGPVAASLARVRGDYCAAVGQGDAARKAYDQAEELLDRAGSNAEQAARRGAHGRSTEDFLKLRQFDRAAAEIHAWQAAFPAERIDGYLTLLYARCWSGRQRWAQAVAQAEQLQAVNADSPYVDQLLMLAAACELRRDRTDRAIATLHTLVKDYPGSPLAPAAQAKLAELENASPPKEEGKKP